MASNSRQNASLKHRATEIIAPRSGVFEDRALYRKVLMPNRDQPFELAGEIAVDLHPEAGAEETFDASRRSACAGRESMAMAQSAGMGFTAAAPLGCWQTTGIGEMQASQPQR